jgi:Phage portal protein, SPP1 Gp6-like
MNGDENTIGSDKWWFKKLSGMLDKERARFECLDRYFKNDPPTYDSLLAMKAADDPSRIVLQDFLKRSRSNFAELVVEAAREKMLIRGFRTSADQDETGDEKAWEMWTRAGMGVISTDVHQWMLSLSRSYVIVGEVDPETEAPLITAEDPRQIIAFTDPARPQHVMAALKMFQDGYDGRDYAYLYLPNRTVVWVRNSGPGMADPTSHGAVVYGNSEQWSLVPEKSNDETGFPCPVTPFVNKNNIGEYETQTSILDRINFMILQRVMIAAVQAFKQRALKGAPLCYPADYPDVALRGTPIDYTTMFYSSPDAFWLLPNDPDGKPVDIWESSPTDLSPILAACKDDLVHLSAITRTPLHYLNPESANQSAEGASLIREGFVSRTEDRMARSSPPWSRVMSLAFLRMGDPERAKLAQIVPMWRQVEQIPLSERAAATSALYGKVPFRTLMSEVMHFDPDQVARIETERMDDQLLNAALMAQQAALAPQQPGEQQQPGGQQQPPQKQQGKKPNAAA